jgi:AraC-like DNA-binding protein
MGINLIPERCTSKIADDMKPQLLKVMAGPSCSFSMRQDRAPINNRWHYHTEIELIHFKEGCGAQFIGDNIRNFKSGDVILVGSNLPHYWSFDEQYLQQSSNPPDIYVAHFCEHFLGREFLGVPENLPLMNLLEQAKRGIQVEGRTREIVGELLERMLRAEGSRKILLLLESLITIADSDEIKLLSSIGFQSQMKDTESDRINSIYQYSMTNYKRKIQTEEIAAVANMSPNSFCRYFKSKTRKTYSNFLIEIRVGIACRLLIENKISIKQICYESGFNNFASFHKYFKMTTGKTPLTYQREFMFRSN